MKSTEKQPTGSNIPERVWNTLLQIESLAENWVIYDKPFIHTYGRLPGEAEIRAWSIPRSSGYLLLSLCRIVCPALVLEIGTSFAYSTLWLASGSPDFSEIHTVELLPEKILIAQAHIEQAGVTNVTLHKEDAIKICRSWKKSIDLLFLDADPVNYINYISVLDCHMRLGSLLIMDNAINHYEVTKDFIEHIKGRREWKSWILPQDNGLLIAIKTDI